MENEPENVIKSAFKPAEEKYKLITNDMVEGIKPYYYISNYGNIYSSFSDKNLNSGIDSKGYKYVALSTENGPKNQRIHRLVMLAFDNNDGEAKNYIGNHLDGNKLNNCLWNIERTDFSGNMQHAYKFGLITNSGAKGSLTDEQVLEICELFKQGKFASEIAKMYGVGKDTIYNIRCGRTYKHLTKDLNLPSQHILDDFEIKSLCEYFQNHKADISTTYKKHDYLVKALENCNVEVNRVTLDTAARILRKKSFKNISNNYNF